MINRYEETGETGLEVAVIGMAGRFPGAANIHEFWENLKNGVESVSFFTDEELEGVGIHPQQIELPNYIKARGYLENIEYFDAEFFGFIPGEAAVMDPQLRFFHECAWEALEDAGCDPDTCEGLIGVYFGSSDNPGWKFRIEVTGGVGGGRFAESLLSTTHLIATRLSYQLNLTGPSTTVNSACSTSLVAIHRACRGLLGGECDIALAGGVSITVPQKSGYFYWEGMIDSLDGHCRAFDTRANGTLFGSGIGVVILKRLDEAVEEGNHIYAVIKGTAVNNDGRRKVGYTAPSVEGQGDVIRAAYQVAEVDPDSIGYIETHGTGTTLGDPVEIKALNRGMKRTSTRFCPIGAVKTNIGHLDAAAGAAGFIKTVLCLQHRLIPPTLHFKTPNPELELDKTRFYVNARLMEWERVDNRPLRAGVSSFGIGGTNAHVVLEEWRGGRLSDGKSSGEAQYPPSSFDEYQLILLSAKTATALEKMSHNLEEYLKRNLANPVNPGNTGFLADVAYTLQNGRKAFVHRKALVCSSVEQTIDALTQPGSPAVQTLVANEEFRQTVFMFAGQGSQYVNMGLGLYQEEPVFREELDCCFDILKSLMGYDIKEILYPSLSVSSGFGLRLPTASMAKNINQTEVTQPIIFVFEYALAKLLIHWGITPDALIGYSFGEYMAACLAGVFSLEDALALIVLRGQLMQGLSIGAMLSVPLPETELRPLLDEGVSIAIVNEPACIVAGEIEAIERFENKMKQHRLMCMRLNADFAVHTSIMADAVKTFEAKLRQISLHEPRIPYISGITGDWINPREVVDYRCWIRHLRETIRFSKGIRRLLEEKKSIFIEIGPGRDLTVLVKRYIDKEAPQPVINLIRPSRKDVSDMSYLLRQLGRLWLYRQDIDWKALHSGSAEKRYLIPLPTYPFERKPYWIDEDLYKRFIVSILDTRTQKSKIPEDGGGGIDNWFYLPSWKRTGIREIGEVPADSNRICLIFSSNYNYGDEGETLITGLIKYLKQKGVDTVMVTPGTSFTCHSSSHYQLDPREADHYDFLLEELGNKNRVPRWIVHLWNVTWEKEPPELSETNLENEQYYGFYSLVYLAQALGSHGIDETLKILVVSNHMQEVMEGDLWSPGKSTLLGPVKVIPQEYPNIYCRSVDIDMPLSRGMQQERLIGRLVTEMVIDTPDAVIAYRGNQRWVQVFEPVFLENPKTGTPYLKDNGVYLITGGLGGIGLVLAGHFARQVKAKLILTSRSGLPDRQQGGRLRELEELGVEVLVMAADAADRQQMERVIHEVKERFGSINGVIHTAGVPDYGGVIQGRGQEKKSKISEAVLAPKLKGTILLTGLLKEQGIKPDFIVLCSSVASIAAPFGEAAYTAANAFLDAYAHYYNTKVISLPVEQNPGTGIQDSHHSMVCSINWGGWQEVGMVVEALKRSGNSLETPIKGLIKPSEGVDAFDRILNSEFSQVVVFPLDLNLLLEQPLKKQGGYLEEVPEREIRTRNMHQRPELDIPFVSAENEIQQKLVHIWQVFFGLDQVGIDDDFFDLGGDSLKAMVVASDIQREFNINITLVEFFKHNTIRELAGYISGSFDDRNVYSTIRHAEEKEYYPLSPAQKRLYILQQMESDSIVYNETSVVELPRGLDIQKFEDTFRRLISRHEGLRTSFLMIKDQPVQRVYSNVGFKIEWLASKSVDINRDFVRPFDLASPPLVRVGLVETGKEKYILALDMHHIIADGRSQEIFAQEFVGLYTGYKFPFLRIQYKDFVQWLISDQMKASVKKQEVYWLKEFAGDVPCLDLPLDYSRPQVQNFAGGVIHFLSGKAETQALKQLASQKNVTLFMLLLALFNVMLSKLSGQEDIVVGTLIAGREHAELQSVMGMFANTLALRNFPISYLTFTDFLIQLKERVLEAFANQDYPYEELVEQVVTARDTGRNPLFDVVFTFQPFQLTATSQINQTAEVGYAPYESGITRFDMVLTAVDTGNDLAFKLEYCTRLFKRESIQRFISCFKKLVSSLLEESSQKISDFEIITEPEKRQILFDFNDTNKDYLRERTIDQLFVDQVEKRPDSAAVVGAQGAVPFPGDHVSITYKELNKKSNQLACLLRKKGVLTDSIVGIMMYRSIEMIIGILGILKARGAYLPIDPEYPEERIDYMLKDSNAIVLLKNSKIRIPKFEINPNDQNSNDQNEIGKPIVLNFEHLDFNFLNGCPSLRISDFEFRASNLSSSNLSYIIYTSGTTGKPKATLTTNANVIRVVKNSNYIDITAHDRLLQLSNYAFDGSVFDIYGALANGAILVMLRAEEIIDAERLSRIIKEQAITCFFITTALFNTLVELALSCFQGVRKVLFGGETVSVLHVRKALAYLGKDRIMHVYGPTETTVYATYYHVDQVGEKAETIPIGSPISNTAIYILDKVGKPVPIMVSGEVYIGGEGVARGYLNQPELTAEKFRRAVVSHSSLVISFSKSSNDQFIITNDRLYRTGDLARWLVDGNIEFLGRIDQQVKIRGFRVELGEIEYQLLKHDRIKEVLVTARDDVAHGKQLCAYFVSDNEPSISQLRNDLAKELPEYMIPSYFVYLEAFPLTPQGKIDRRSLPAPEVKVYGEYIAPRDEIEKKLAEIWTRILGIEKSEIGIDSGFFQLGGNSLKATVLKSRIHKELNVVVQLADIFKNPAIRGLCEHIRGSEIHEYTTVKAVEEKEFHELSYNQRRLWIIQQLDPKSPSYNLTGVISLKHQVNGKIIKKVLSAITARHESFRTYFTVVKEEPFQFVTKTDEIAFEMKDISSIEPNMRIKRRMQIIDEVIRVPFDLEQAPLFRSILIKVDKGMYDFVFNMHHIISDGWSMEILKKEFILLYKKYKEHREIDLEELEIQYKDFSEWQKAQLRKPAHKEKAHRYWQRRLSEELPELRLTRYVNEVYNMDEFAVWEGGLKAEVKDKLNRVAADMGTSTFMLCFSGVNILLAWLSGQKDIFCGLLAAGREHAALQNIVGFFVNTLILKNHIDFADDFSGFLPGMSKDTLEALEFQGYPLELVFEELEIKYPEIPVMFNMINIDDSQPVGTPNQGEPYHLDQYPAGKFDIDFHVLENKNGIDVRCIYRKRWFRCKQMKYVLQQYLYLMEKIAAEPAKKIEDYFSSRRKRHVSLG
jgi:iturin family lipopeptide synthetase A